MKFLWAILVVFGFAFATATKEESIKGAVKLIAVTIAKDKLDGIIQACINDPEIQKSAASLTRVHSFVRGEVEKNAEIQSFVTKVKGAGITIDWIKDLAELWVSGHYDTIDPSKPVSCGGVQGLLKRIREAFTTTYLLDTVRQAIKEFPEFGTFWQENKPSDAAIQNLKKNINLEAIMAKL